MTEEDPYQWLEEIDGARAMAWVTERNADATALLAKSEEFARTRDRLLDALDAKGRLPVPGLHGGYLYNFWRDARNPRGVWRRTTLAGYRLVEPDWRLVLDLDRLAAEEGENWVWQGASLLRPRGTRALVSLSRGGADASVVREFDLERRAFVPDGFALPEAKSIVTWIDQDTIYVGTDEGPGSLTDSGYPRRVREWHRGTPLAEASLVYESEATDVLAAAEHDPTPGQSRDIVYRMIDRLHIQMFLRTGDGGLQRIDVPEDARVDSQGRWLLIMLRSPWTIEDHTHPAGCLLATEFDPFVSGSREMHVLFAPDERTSLLGHARTQHQFILSVSTDVRSELRVLTGDRRGWREQPLTVPAEDGAEDGSELRQLMVADTDPDSGDQYLVVSTGFTEPSTLWHGHAGVGRPERLRREPKLFDTDGLTVEQHFAVSADETRVPYFLVGREGAGPRPVLLRGYGGFENAQLPEYLPTYGRGWLEAGGSYAVANIRGGGEYGPAWHQAAIRENRFRAYEDFAAVAADLVARGLTTADRLAAVGGSNGGLLTGVMLTRYPELFGAVVIRQPLADMRRYHRLLAGASWMAEYGDPDDDADWEFLRRYSPYHNVSANRAYPPVLIMTSTRDDRVHPGHARKLAARLIERGHDVTYYENDEGGHAGAADHAQQAHVAALMFEFLWARLGRDPS